MKYNEKLCLIIIISSALWISICYIYFLLTFRNSIIYRPVNKDNINRSFFVLINACGFFFLISKAKLTICVPSHLFGKQREYPLKSGTERTKNKSKTKVY